MALCLGLRGAGKRACNIAGSISQIVAQQNNYPVRPVVISTDPPYYDNITYADLSIFSMFGIGRLSEVFGRNSTEGC